MTRHAPRLLLLIGLLLVIAPRAWSLDVAWDAKVGGELDTNVERRVGASASPEFVARAFASLDVRGRTGNGTALSLSGRVGGRVPSVTRAEDSVSSQLTLGARRWLSDRVWMGAVLEGRDLTLRNETRDYTRGNGRWQTGLEWERVGLQLGVGAAGFWFRPDPTLSSWGPDASAMVTWYATDAFQVAVGGDGSVRVFEGAQWVRGDSGSVERSAEHRNDQSLSGTVQVGASGSRWIVSSDYRITRNFSDSLGSSYVRHTVSGEFGVVPFADVLLRVAAKWQRNRYDELANLDATLNVDEDSRSGLSALVEVPLPGGFSAIEARVEHFADDLGVRSDSARYRRWVAWLGVSFGSPERPDR